MNDGFVDPYLDPATGILSNTVGAATQVALDAAEGALTFVRLLQLLQRPPRPTGDLAELRAIHALLFGDVYDWAGQTRTVDIRKSIPGAQHFLPVSVIERAASFAAAELASENMLTGLNREAFITRLAHHYDAFNYIHPFREGNGRTQRVFFDRIAREAGWPLDWRGVAGQVNDLACRTAAEQRDFTAMHQMLDTVVAAHPQPATSRGQTPEGGGGAEDHSSLAARLGFLAGSAASMPPTSPGPAGAQGPPPPRRRRSPRR